MGWKQYVDGETLDVAEVQELADQGVIPYASRAVRNAAISAPVLGMVTLITTDPPLLEYYDGGGWSSLPAGTLVYPTTAARDAAHPVGPGAAYGTWAFVTAGSDMSFLTTAGWYSLATLAGAVATLDGAVSSLDGDVFNLVRSGSLTNVTIGNDNTVAVGVAPAFIGAGTPNYVVMITEPGTIGLSAHIVINNIFSQSNNGFLLDLQRADGTDPTGEVISIYYIGHKAP